MKVYTHWQKDNFVGTSESDLPGRKMASQLVPPIGNKQPNIILNPQNRGHFQVWQIILDVFGDGGIPGARKT
jgi:hypothetical protein